MTNNMPRVSDIQKFSAVEMDARAAAIASGSNPWDIKANVVTARAADPYEATSLALHRRLWS